MTISRRRFLAIAAASAFLPRTATADTGFRRTGRALGAPTSLHLRNTTPAEAEAVFADITAELARLERIFSLYDPSSQLVTLNTERRLQNPAPELLEVFGLCSGLHRVTDGAFDPTIQPLWAHHAGLAETENPRALIGWNKVAFDASSIELAQPGMQLTLNGIAQGYITDRIAALLRARGLTQVMIDMGEVAALGHKAEGFPWTAGVAMPSGKVIARVQLTDRALATSSAEGLMLDAKAGIGHILDPRSAGLARQDRLVAISSPSAAIADGLSTAGCLIEKPVLLKALGKYQSANLEVFV